jgi:hypothetical protein
LPPPLPDPPPLPPPGAPGEPEDFVELPPQLRTINRRNDPRKMLSNMNPRVRPIGSPNLSAQALLAQHRSATQILKVRSCVQGCTAQPEVCTGTRMITSPPFRPASSYIRHFPSQDSSACPNWSQKRLTSALGR